MEYKTSKIRKDDLDEYEAILRAEAESFIDDHLDDNFERKVYPMNYRDRDEETHCYLDDPYGPPFGNYGRLNEFLYFASLLACLAVLVFAIISVFYFYYIPGVLIIAGVFAAITKFFLDGQ